ncbi:hypothetical protein ACJX0J_041007, partial [Zea mays]
MFLVRYLFFISISLHYVLHNLRLAIEGSTYNLSLTQLDRNHTTSLFRMQIHESSIKKCYFPSL